MSLTHARPCHRQFSKPFSTIFAIACLAFALGCLAAQPAVVLAGGAETSSGSKAAGAGPDQADVDPCGCFGPETLILMADSSLKAIKDIRVGDTVMTWDFVKESTQFAMVEDITRVRRESYYVVDGVQVTAEHPYYTGPGQFTEVQDLEKGTPVASYYHGVEFIPVAEFVKVDKPGDFFNLVVGKTNLFFVQSGRNDRAKLVHNKSSCQPR